ncbi:MULTISPECIES: GNAT family N-acetyltransferase [Pseudoalteromonas]|uniref:GNAT family N-acetyltransferase n=1 Tax=Pseudoalteromonas amylolytica TaxID=1859457 RepID=A0A1S1MR29_9GAMM|nr:MULTISPECIES: GNAT family N-acetyltransferase [Pseudoalteromonas]OHU87775.1 GNAT family N-acetyltransferase [Pseudoalteromonas sp. JW3]OHU91215.1 GNAT family N-acetyltransferase [Pseudoalteromonas amylolytica]
MVIRELLHGDCDEVSKVCMSSFMNSVAGTLSEQGIVTFKRIASGAALSERMTQDNLMLVAVINGRVAGYVELKQGQHIAMLFVAPQYQKQGVGRRLLSSLKSGVSNTKLTVHASTTSVSAYERYGFISVGDIAVSEGLVYQPMEININNFSE